MQNGYNILPETAILIGCDSQHYPSLSQLMRFTEAMETTIEQVAPEHQEETETVGTSEPQGASPVGGNEEEKTVMPSTDVEGAPQTEEPEASVAQPPQIDDSPPSASEAAETPGEAEAAATETEALTPKVEGGAKNGHPMDALAEEEFDLKQFRRGQMVRGIILSKTDSEIIVDIGGKSEGIVPSQDLARLDEEFLSELNVGDEIVAYVLTPEGREGHAVLSLSKARGEYEWERVARWQEENATIEAEVAEANRGGVVVLVGHLRGFVPGSQLVPRPETRRAESPEDRFAPLKGQVLRLKVLEVDRKRRRLILSEKEAEKEERAKRRQALLQELRKGEVRRGRVSSITKFGAFVDLGGVDGLIHISELSWGRVEHPSDVVKEGDEVEVFVLDVDRERERVSLSLRRLQPKPWETVLERYAIGQVVEGTVTRVVPFGAFVRLDDGIEGLVHISELADRYVAHPHEVVHEGDRVQVRILNIDPKAKRMGLSIRQVSEEEYVEVDWEEADEEDLEEGTWEALVDVMSSGEGEEAAEEDIPSAETSIPTPQEVEEVDTEVPTSGEEQPGEADTSEEVGST